MDVYEAIEKRRTIRKFKKGASEQQLRRIIAAGTKAPSARNRQPWEFIIIEDQGLVDKLAEFKYRLTRKADSHRGEQDDDQLAKAALAQKESFLNASIVAICHEVEWERSVWLCMENMSLAAVAEGLGSGIVLYWGEEKEQIEKTLGLPTNIELTAIMKFGEPGEEGYPRESNPYAPRREEFSWLHKDRYEKIETSDAPVT